MDRRSFQFCSHIGEERGDLFRRPAQQGQDLKANTIQRGKQVLLKDDPQGLVVVALGPGAVGPVEVPLNHVLEAGLLHPSFVVRRVGQRTAGLGGSEAEEVRPATQGILRIGVAGKFEGVRRVLQLEVAARRAGFKGLPDNEGRILEAACEGAPMDEVELVIEDPLVFCIADLEFTVPQRAIVRR